jgi:ubiquinone/menaquinone biosynthesis C-methylase UbiE
MSKKHASQADKSGGKIGDEMEQVYGNYFSNEGALDKFLEALTSRNLFEELSERAQTERLKILEIGANNGVVGEYVSNYLESRNIEHQLVISDMNKQALQDNNNPDTLKIKFDNKQIPFIKNSFDLILSRSVTHYESTSEDKKQVLSDVKRVLTDQGVFVNQAVAFETKAEINLLLNIHEIVDKHMNGGTEAEVLESHREVFDTVDVSEVKLPKLKANKSGFMERYNIEQQEQVANKIKEKIRKVDEEKRPHVSLGENFSWSVPYRILFCKN